MHETRPTTRPNPMQTRRRLITSQSSTFHRFPGIDHEAGPVHWPGGHQRQPMPADINMVENGGRRRVEDRLDDETTKPAVWRGERPSSSSSSRSLETTQTIASSAPRTAWMLQRYSHEAVDTQFASSVVIESAVTRWHRLRPSLVHPRPPPDHPTPRQPELRQISTIIPNCPKNNSSISPAVQWAVAAKPGGATFSSSQSPSPVQREPEP
jgi:hypothetical protein